VRGEEGRGVGVSGVRSVQALGDGGEESGGGAGG
jgi:hypothetical protein